MFLLKFTGTYDDTTFAIESYFMQTPFPYAMSVQVEQPYGHFLLTNYNTIRDALYENNEIHFFFNSLDINNGKAGIFHGIIQYPGNTNQLECMVLTSDILSMGYPSAVYAGTDPSDQTYLIGLNYTSPDHFPGNALVKYSNGSYSEILIIKEGEFVMNMTSSTAERWGDYTSMQIKYNEPWIVFFLRIIW